MGTWALESVAMLPDEIEVLAASARHEGFRFVDRLIEDYRSGANTFAKPEEVLIAIRQNGRLVGVGGLNIDPFEGSVNVGRLRRLYVDPNFRGRGVGRALVRALETIAVQHFCTLRLFTDDHDAARFYRSLGYAAVSSDANASHQKLFTDRP